MKKYILIKNGKKLLSILVILLFILVSTSCSKEEKYPNSGIEKKTIKVVEEKVIDNHGANTIKKLDEDKEVIYDAIYLEELEPYMGIDFQYDEKGEVVEKEVEINFDNCKIPYINLDSKGAKKINEEILEYTRDVIFGDYEHGKEEGYAYDPMAYYNYEVTEDYISIKFEYNIGLYEIPDDIKTFVLDLESGEELSLERAIEIAAIDEDFLGLVEGKIVEFYDEMLVDFQEFDPNATFFDYQAYTLYNFWQEYYGEELNFYLNAEKEMSLLITFEVLAGGGFFQKELEIKPKDLPLKKEINPVYEYLAKDEYDSYEGGAAFLGYNSIDTMETITSKVETIIYDVGYEGRLSLFYFYDGLDDGSYGINGDEFYLLAAKHKNSVIKIYRPRYEENGEIRFDDEQASLHGSNCISFCNFSDIRPNTKVEFVYRDKTIEFTPSLSLMDSSYINEIYGIIDLSDAYRDLEESEIYLESTSSLPYMWQVFKMADFIE